MSCIAPNSNCIQDADDSILYHSYKLKEKDKCIKELENDITLVAKWSDKTNMVFMLRIKCLCDINPKMNKSRFVATT